MKIKNPTGYINHMREMLSARLSQYFNTMENSRQSIQTSVNAWTVGMREYFKMSNGFYGPEGRVLALMMRLRNPDIGTVFDLPPTYEPPENSAERQRDDTTTPHHQKTLVDRLMEKLSVGSQRRNSEGGKYSGKGYTDQRYQNAAYADQSQPKPSRVYTAAEIFKKMADASRRLRSIYQRSGNNGTALVSGEYNPHNNIAQQSEIVNFADYKRRAATVTNMPIQQSGTIDDTLEDAV